MGAESMNRNYRKKTRILLLMLSKVLRLSGESIFFVDDQGIVRLVNKAASTWLNKRKSEIIGCHINKVFPDLSKLDFALKENVSIEFAQKINGMLYQIKFVPITLRNACVGRFVKFRDISKSEELQELNRELDAIIEACADGIYVTDGEGNTLRINTACQNITGLVKDEVIGGNMKEIVAKGLLSSSCTLKVLETRSRVSILQNVPSGKLVVVTGTPIFDEKGNIWRVVCNTRDLTELNQLKTQLEEERRLKDQYYVELVNFKLKEMSTSDSTIIACSKEMQKVVELAMRVASTETTILIKGESGVGKDVIARFIHENSPRKGNAFVKINCAAIPENLLESELFGYESGAFTGAAKKGKPGLIELADKGTLFLDEIGEMPLSLQAKLLQVLQERVFFRVGGTKPVKVNTRIIAATNQDIEKLVEEGRFRNDLYYRLNVIPIYIPPLRERREDIPPLTYKFLAQINCKYRLNKLISNEVVDILVDYSWPGNVRELENLVERMVVTTYEDIIMPKHLPKNIQNEKAKRSSKITVSGVMTFGEALEEVEKQLFLRAYERYRSTHKAAKALGVSQPTVVRKLRKYKDKVRKVE